MKQYNLRTDQFTLYKTSYHGQILYNQIPDKNPALVPSCPECHGIHGATPAGVKEVAHVCGNCHSSTQEYFEKSAHYEALARIGTPRCIDCHAYHDIHYPTKAMYDGTEMYHCGYCHDVNQKEYGMGQEIKAAFVGSENRVNEVWEKVVVIETGPGLDVLDEKDKLEQARRLILEAIPVSHTLDMEEINKYRNEIMGLAGSVDDSIEARQEEFIVRKRSLFTTLMILLVIIAFLIYKRRTMQPNPETDSGPR